MGGGDGDYFHGADIGGGGGIDLGEFAEVIDVWAVGGFFEFG